MKKLFILLIAVLGVIHLLCHNAIEYLPDPPVEIVVQMNPDKVYLCEGETATFTLILKVDSTSVSDIDYQRQYIMLSYVRANTENTNLWVTASDVDSNTVFRLNELPITKSYSIKMKRTLFTPTFPFVIIGLLNENEQNKKVQMSQLRNWKCIQGKTYYITDSKNMEYYRNQEKLFNSYETNDTQNNLRLDLPDDYFIAFYDGYYCPPCDYVYKLPNNNITDVWATPPHDGIVNKLLCNTSYTFEYSFPVSNVSISGNSYGCTVSLGNNGCSITVNAGSIATPLNDPLVISYYGDGQQCWQPLKIISSYSIYGYINYEDNSDIVSPLEDMKAYLLNTNNDGSMSVIGSPLTLSSTGYYYFTVPNGTQNPSICVKLFNSIYRCEQSCYDETDTPGNTIMYGGFYTNSPEINDDFAHDGTQRVDISFVNCHFQDWSVTHEAGNNRYLVNLPFKKITGMMNVLKQIKRAETYMSGPGINYPQRSPNEALRINAEYDKTGGSMVVPIPGVNYIIIDGMYTDPNPSGGADLFDNAIILHECGHLWEKMNGVRLVNSAAAPDLIQNEDAAFVEGIAIFFSSLIRDNTQDSLDPPVDWEFPDFWSDGTLWSNYNLETGLGFFNQNYPITVPPSGEDKSGSIASLLWDLYDDNWSEPASSPHNDVIQVDIAKILKAITPHKWQGDSSGFPSEYSGSNTPDDVLDPLKIQDFLKILYCLLSAEDQTNLLALTQSYGIDFSPGRSFIIDQNEGNGYNYTSLNEALLSGDLVDDDVLILRPGTYEETIVLITT